MKIIPGHLCAKLQIKKSNIHGMGLFALQNIPAKSKIGNLRGEVISKRAARHKASRKRKIAIIELWNGFALDSSEVKNELCYINHSCMPNCYMRNIGNLVEVYSLRQIERFEELTCDYGETHHGGSIRCNCKQKKCKNFL